MITIAAPIGFTISALFFILLRKNIELNVGMVLGAWIMYGAMIYL